MKKILLSITLLMFCVFTYAQTNFDKKISEKSESLKSAKTAGDFEVLYNTFSDLRTENDVNRWKAYYYAGMAQYQKGELLLKKAADDGASESNALAYKNAMGAFTSQQGNVEIQKLLKLIEIQRKKIINANMITLR